MHEKPPRNVFAKRSFGQNFLVDTRYIDRIVNSLSLDGDSSVVEIGAGRGALTEKLLERAGKVYAIELDRDLIPLLTDKFARTSNFNLIEADALSFDFSSLAATGRPLNLVANLPYNISTAILLHLIPHRHSFSEMVLMFQREVAYRIAARPGKSDRGSLTVLVEAAFSVEKLFDVSPKAFIPQPQVVSSVVRLIPRESAFRDEKRFSQLLAAAFAKKRKTIGNNFKAISQNFYELLGKAGIDPGRRAETLTLDEWYALESALISE